jgi:DNA-binding MarR family transcriptional regulator
MTKNKLKKLTLSPLEEQILTECWRMYPECTPSAILIGCALNKSHRSIITVLHRLAKRGLVELVRGLINERDGTLCGSGWEVTSEGCRAIGGMSD